MVLAVGLLLGGCTGLEQFPESTDNYKKALEGLDTEYQATLDMIYGAETDDAKKAARNKFIDQRMPVIDGYFDQFVQGLAKENALADLGIALVGVGVGGAGSLVSGSASQILSAVSGGLEGAQAAWDKEVLYEKTLQALIAQMIASRKEVAAQILERSEQSITDYPLWMVQRDLKAYRFAGSLPGAIVATASDAADKEEEAEEVLLEKITSEGVTEQAFSRRVDIESAIDGLNATQAKALMIRIQTVFPIIKPTAARQYPDAVRDADRDGSRAKTVLKRLASDTAITRKAMDAWDAEIRGLNP